jgi:hypothetical protein
VGTFSSSSWRSAQHLVACSSSRAAALEPRLPTGAASSWSALSSDASSAGQQSRISLLTGGRAGGVVPSAGGQQQQQPPYDEDDYPLEIPTRFELMQRPDKQKPLVRVRLSVHFRVHSRQMLCIGGSQIPMGWSFLSISRVPMTWNNGDIWTVEVGLGGVIVIVWLSVPICGGEGANGDDGDSTLSSNPHSFPINVCRWSCRQGSE